MKGRSRTSCFKSWKKTDDVNSHFSWLELNLLPPWPSVTKNISGQFPRNWIAHFKQITLSFSSYWRKSIVWTFQMLQWTDGTLPLNKLRLSKLVCRSALLKKTNYASVKSKHCKRYTMRLLLEIEDAGFHTQHKWSRAQRYRWLVAKNFVVPKCQGIIEECANLKSVDSTSRWHRFEVKMGNPWRLQDFGISTQMQL